MVFIPGLQLCQLFYEEAVCPILQAEFPNLAYSVALIGSGSEVIGYDTERSTDHHWGPRLMLFLHETDYAVYHTQIYQTLAAKLPYTFRGYSTNFGTPDEIGVRLQQQIESGPIAHRVETMTLSGFFIDYLGFDPRHHMTILDWLTTPEQRLLTVTAGRVYYDGLGELSTIREKLAYYPDQVWLYLLASQWNRISQEEHFLGRCGEVGDELGSRIVASRLVNNLMRLCFLIEKRYAPYSKWFGTAFSSLQLGTMLTPMFHRVLSAQTWQEREAEILPAYTLVAEMHNALNITEPLPTQPTYFHNRPFKVIHAETFADAIRQQIKDETLLNLPVIGGIDQFVESTDVLSSSKISRRTMALYEAD